MCGVVAIKPDQLRDLTDQQGVPRLPAVQDALILLNVGHRRRWRQSRPLRFLVKWTKITIS